MLINTPCITLTDDNFQSEVLEAETLVLVDCWASWCSPLPQKNPVIEELAIAFAGRIKIGRLNVATSKKMGTRYDIRAVPTLLVFKDGQLLERVFGSPSQQNLASRLSDLLSDSHPSQRQLAYL
jgi:thioredoxin 1